LRSPGQHVRHRPCREGAARRADEALLGKARGDLAQRQPRPLGLQRLRRGDEVGILLGVRRTAAALDALGDATITCSLELGDERGLPSSFKYALSVATGSVNYSITTPSWLTASSTSGTGTTTAKTITFTINSKARSLGPGTYTDNIGFNNTTNNQGNTTRVATLIVNPKQYRLSVSASPATYGIVSGAGTFAEGSSVTVTATPNGSHSFVNWTQNGKVVSTSASYTFTMPSASATLTAHFR
jgi:hypothetical protein